MLFRGVILLLYLWMVLMRSYTMIWSVVKVLLVCILVQSSSIMSHSSCSDTLHHNLVLVVRSWYVSQLLCIQRNLPVFCGDEGTVLVLSCYIWIAFGNWILKHGHRPLLHTSGKVNVTHTCWIKYTCASTLTFLPRQIIIWQNQILLRLWLLSHWSIIIKLIIKFHVFPLTVPLLSICLDMILTIINILRHILLANQTLIWLLLLLVHQRIHTILLVWQLSVHTRLH